MRLAPALCLVCSLALPPAVAAGCTQTSASPTRPTMSTSTASGAGGASAGGGGQVSGIPAPPTGGAPATGGSAPSSGGEPGTGGVGGNGGTGGAGGVASAGSSGGGGATSAATSGSSATGGGGSATGGGGASVSTSSTASASSASSSSSASSTGSGPAPACAIGHVVIGEVRTRGAGGASDEFVALFNATGVPVVLDDGWQLSVRGTSDTSYRAHWTGAGATIPPWGHYLIGGADYAEAPTPDARLTSGITDAASLRLVHSAATVDALCFGYDATTMAAFDASFTCAGAAASNLPHDDTASASSNVDASLARKPGGLRGACVDTGDSAADFASERPATPLSSASAVSTP